MLRLAMGVLLAMAGVSATAEDVLIADFEADTYGDWNVDGDAFTHPVRADRLDITGHRGLRLANSFGGGDASTGSLTSPLFEVTRGHLAFLIGGGRHPGNTGAELLVDGQSVRNATGDNSGQLRWVTWNVEEFRGREARVRLFDRATGDWGHINADHFLLTDAPRFGAGTWRIDEYRRSADYYTEPFRPAYHFTPELNWMNDPNGLVFLDGEYHLFYQFNPHGNSWGHMSWGHAVSPDLVHWTHLPVALHDELGVMIFSGCAVVDERNTSGFGGPGQTPLVAVYTGHGHGRQTQDLAYSLDRGRSWTKYEQNPVLDIGESEFRDPKVFWHEPTGRWVMVVSLAVAKRIQFYGSPDLKTWTLLSEFGPAGIPGKPNWECPDLFELPIEGEPGQSRWVLEADVGAGSIAGGSGGEYFTGVFDGTTFIADSLDSQWVDFGRDFYAPVSWSNVPPQDGRRLWIGWMNNWETCLNPTWPWRSAMSTPREVTLRRIDGALRMCQQPVRELEALRGERISLGAADLDDAARDVGVHGQQLELIVEFEPGSASEVGLRVLKGDGEETTIGWSAAERSVFVDRTRSGIVDFHERFPGRHAGPLPAVDGRVRLRVLVDRSSVEVFGNAGETVVTDLVFPKSTSDRVELYAVGGAAKVVSCDIWPLKSVWRQPAVGSR
ncbi:MAG: glycoside hydrolase family 32 protein [Planctomyces sp.]|nr:glycoside hydrolase family 32 protein [Planctomyces sp.]